MASELGNKITITMKENTNQFIINSNNYTTFTAEAMEYLTSELSNVDLARVFKMSNMLRTDCSVICQGNNHPHTPESLSVVLDMSSDEFYRMVSRMRSKNILAYCVCSPSGYVQKIYMLNPYVARKRTRMNCELNMFFRDVTKDRELKD